jgi:hypothetical protein
MVQANVVLMKAAASDLSIDQCFVRFEQVNHSPIMPDVVNLPPEWVMVCLLALF